MAKSKEVKEVKEAKKQIKKLGFVDIEESIFINLIEQDGCNPYVNDIAKILGVSWSTVQRYITAHPNVNKAMLDRRFEIRDIAEKTINSILIDTTTDKKTKADLAKWVLKNVDDRFREKLDVAVKGDIAHTINVVVKDNDDKDNLDKLLND